MMILEHVYFLFFVLMSKLFPPGWIAKQIMNAND